MKTKILFGFLGILVLVVTLLIVNSNYLIPEKNINHLEEIEQYEKDLTQITCYCGCEHTSLYNCYEEGMLTNCGVCMKEYETYLELKETKSVEEISKLIDEKYGELNG